jgi:tetratricopeptide (TPR) repeat protein
MVGRICLIALAACCVTGQELLDASRTYAAKGEFDRAIGAAQDYLKSNPESIPGKLTLGNAYFMSARLHEAKDIALEVLHVDPVNSAALEMKGNAEYLMGEVTGAIDTFIDLLEKHPDNQDAPYMLGRIYYQEGRVDQAIGQFERVLKLNPRAYKAYDNLGLCLQAKGDNETAESYFLTAIKLVEKDHPEYDSAYANLAELLLNKGDPQKAFDAAAKAANRNPRSARDFYLGGKALERLDKLDLSLNWLQRSAALDPQYAQPQFLLARVYRRLGQPEKANEAQQKFLALKAKAPTVRR